MNVPWVVCAAVWAAVSGCGAGTPAPETAGTPATEPAGTVAAERAPVAAPARAVVVAVFDVEDGTQGLAPADARQLADYLAARVAAIPHTRVVPRDQLRQALAEAKAQSYQACFDQSCQIELGKALSAEKSLATKLLRVGKRCAMTAVFFDLRTETTERAATVQTECAADALLGATDALVRQLGGEAESSRAPSALPASAPGPAPPRADAAPERASPSPERNVAPRARAEAAPLELVLDESGARAEPAPVGAVGGAGSPAPGPAASAPWEPRFNGRSGHTILVLPGPVVFGEGRDDLDGQSRQILDRVAAGILADRRLGAAALEVVGHAGSSERGRAELSERRARAARAYLLKRGLAVSRLGVVGASDGDPLPALGGDHARQRRVEIRLARED